MDTPEHVEAPETLARAEALFQATSRETAIATADCSIAGGCQMRGHCLHLAASAGEAGEFAGDDRRIPMGVFQFGRIAGERTKVVADDIGEDELYCRARIAAHP